MGTSNHGEEGNLGEGEGEQDKAVVIFIGVAREGHAMLDIEP